MLDAVVKRVVRYLELLTVPAAPSGGDLAATPWPGDRPPAGDGKPTDNMRQPGDGVLVSDGRVLRLLREAAGSELSVFPDGRMLVWDIARHDGYNIPAYPMAGCGDVKEFLADEGARDVPDWYRVHLGMDAATYDDIYKYELVMVRNRLRFRRVWMVPAATMAEGEMSGGPLAAAMLEWARFALGECTDEEDSRLFKR